jgi:dihydrofolate reductase
MLPFVNHSNPNPEEDARMRKLILQMQMSVDGFVGSHQHDDWQLWGWGEHNEWDEELKRDFNLHFERLDMILLSRKMAEEGYLDHWGKAAERYPADQFYAFAKRITERKKVVLTDKLKTSAWPRTDVRGGDLGTAVTAMKAEAGGDIGVFGGAGFASALIGAGVVDEFQLYINPAALGTGRRIFGTSGFRKLKLLNAKAYPSGMVVSRYAKAEATTA